MLKRFISAERDIATHLSDSMRLGLRMETFHRLATRLDGLDYAAAAKAGIHPDEVDAIRAMRLTGIDPARVDALLSTMDGHDPRGS